MSVAAVGAQEVATVRADRRGASAPAAEPTPARRRLAQDGPAGANNGRLRLALCGVGFHAAFIRAYEWEGVLTDAAGIRLAVTVGSLYAQKQGNT